jgi:hypothetical protein
MPENEWLFGGKTSSNGDPKKDATGVKSSTGGEPILSSVDPSTFYRDDSQLRTGAIYDLDFNKYSKYLNAVRPEHGIDILNYTRAVNQTSGQKLANFGVQVLGEVAGLTVSGLGSLLELGIDRANPVAGLVNQVMGRNVQGAQDFDNFLVSAGEGLRQLSKDIAPIYEQRDGASWALGDLGWWLNRGVSVSSTVGLLIPGQLVTRGVGLLAKLAVAGKAGKLLQGAATAVAGTRMQQEVGKILTNALVMRHAENITEAFQIVNNVKDEAITRFREPGRFEEDLKTEAGQAFMRSGADITPENFAKFLAGTAGHRTYNMNSLNIFFDIFQSAALMRPHYFTRGAGKTVKTMEAELGRSLTTAEKAWMNAKNLGVFALEPVTESIEEMVNHISQVQAKAEYDTGIWGKRAPLLGETIATEAGKPQMWESAFWGALGGLAFSGVTRLSRMIDNANDPNKTKDEAYRIAEIKGRGTKLSEYVGRVAITNKKVESGLITKDEGDIEIAQARRELGHNMGVNAANAGTVDGLLNMLDNASTAADIAKTLTPEQIKAGGIEDVNKLREDLKEEILATERDYNNAVNKWYNTKTENPTTLNLLIQDYIRLNFAKRSREKLITSADGLFRNELNNNPEYTNLKNAGIPVDLILERKALSNIDPLYKEYADKRIAGIDQVLTGANTNIGKLGTDKKINELAAAVYGGKIAQQYTTDKLSTMGSTEHIAELDKKVTKVEEAKKKADEAKQFADYKKAIEKNIEGKTVDQQLTDLNNELTSADTSDKKKYLQTKIDHLTKIKQEAEAKVKPQAPPVQPTVQATQKEFSTEAISEDEYLTLSEEIGSDPDSDKFITELGDIVSDSTKSTTQKLEALIDLKSKTTDSRYRKIIDFHLNRQGAAIATESVNKNLVSAHSDKHGITVNVGDKVQLNDDEVEVKSIVKNDDGSISVIFSSISTSSLYTTPLDKYIESVVQNRKGAVNEQQPDTDSMTTFKEILNATIPNLPFEFYELTNDYELIVDNTQAEVITVDPTNSRIILNFNKFNDLFANDHNKFTEIVLHELVHIAANNDTFSNNEELVKLIKKIIILSDQLGQEISDIRRAILAAPADQILKEFLAYYLTNDAFFTLVNSNTNAKLGINDIVQHQLETGNPVLSIFFNKIKDRAGNLKYAATPSARQLIKQYNITDEVADTIPRTGKNDTLTVKDVRDFLKKNQLRSGDEIITMDGLIHQPFEVEGANVFVHILTHGIVNGVVDAKAYNEEVTRIYGSKAIHYTQEELEQAIALISSPFTNVNTRLTLMKSTKYDGIGIYLNDVLIGFVNNIEETQYTLSILRKLETLNTVEEVDEFLIEAGKASRPLNNRKYFFEMRKRAIRGETRAGTTPDKSITDEVKRFEKILGAEQKLLDSFNKHMENTPGVPFTAKITRKTTGTIASNKDQLIPISEGFTGIQSYQIMVAASADPLNRTLLSTTGNFKYVRPFQLGAYYNMDNAYEYAFGVYVLIPTAASIPGDIRTYVPVPVFGNTNPSEAYVNEAYNIMMEIAERARYLKANEPETSVALDERISELRQELKYLFEVDFSFKREKEKKDNYISIDDNGITLDFKQNGETRHLHIKFSTSASGDMVMYNVASRHVGTSGFTARNTKDFTSPTTGNPVMTLSYQQGTTSQAVKQRKAFQEQLKAALRTKRTNFPKLYDAADDGSNFASTDYNEQFRNTGLTIGEFAIKHGGLLTDVLPLRRGDGTVIRDVRGNQLTTVVNKNTQHGSNMIITIEPDSPIAKPEVKPIVDDVAPGGPAVINTTETASVNTETPEPVSIDQPTDEVIGGIITAYNSKDNPPTSITVEEALSKLFAGEAITTAEFSIKAIINLKASLPAGYVLVPNNGKFTLAINDSTIKSKADNTKGKQVTGAENLTKLVDRAEVETWWKETFGENVPLDMNIVGIIRKGGKKLWGYFEDGMVALSQSAPAGTQYHEAFHVVFWLYLTDQERLDIYNEAKEKHGNLDLVSLEENIADDFMGFMLNGGKLETVKPKSKIGKFFAKLRELILKLFGRYTSKETRTDQVFNRIADGYYATQKPQLKDSITKAARSIARYKAIEELNNDEEYEAIRIIAGRVMEIIETSSGYVDATSDIVNIDDNNNLDTSLSENVRLADKIKKSILDEVDKVSEDQALKIFTITDTTVYDQLWTKAISFVQTQSKVVIDENAMVVKEQLLQRSWDDTKNNISQRSKVLSTVKRLVMTTYAAEVSKNFGVTLPVEFGKVYPYLQRIMYNAPNIEEMLARLEVFSGFDAALIKIKENLEANPNLKAAWFSSFSNQHPNVQYVYIDENSTKVDQSDKSSTHYAIANAWINAFQSKLESGVFTRDMVQRISRIYGEGEYLINNDKFEEGIKKVTEALNLLGVNIKFDKIVKALTMPHILEKRDSTTKSLFNSYVSKVFFLIKEISTYNLSPSTYKFSNRGNLNRLAQLESILTYDLLENSSLNVNGDMFFSFRDPSMLSEFMSLFEAVHRDNLLQVNNEYAREQLLSVLTGYARDLMMTASNWLWESKQDAGDGMLRLVEGRKNANGLTTSHLNLGYIEKFGHTLLDGLKSGTSSARAQYDTMTEFDWNFTRYMMYFGNTSEGDNLTTVKIPIPIQADSGNIEFITVPRYSNINDIRKALANLALQDIYRAIGARNLMFDYNEEDGTLSVKPGLNMNVLIPRVHFNGYDADGKPLLLDKDGQPTGNVFQHYKIPTAKGIGFNGRIPNYDKGETRTSLEWSKIVAAVDEYIAKVRKETAISIKPYAQHLTKNSRYKTNFGKDHARFAFEYAMNFKIATAEQQNFITGTESEFKDSIYDPNKRARTATSPGRVSYSSTGESFTGVSIKDIELTSEYLKTMAEHAAKEIKRQRPELKNDVVNFDAILNKNPVQPLDIAVFDLLGKYLSIKIGDGQAYMTVKHWKELNKRFGRIDPVTEALIDKAINDGELTDNEVFRIMQVMKGAYNYRGYDAATNMMLSNQLKYSVVPLIPSLIKGTQLELVNDWMNKHDIGQVFFGSSEKFGGRDPLEISNGKGEVDQAKLDTITPVSYPFRQYYYNAWRLQQDAQDHFVDEINKLGTQIAKIFLTNLDPNATYEYAGKKVKAQDLIKDFMSTMTKRIREDANNLLDAMGVKRDASGAFVVGDINKIRKVLLNEVNRRLLPENYRDALDLEVDASGNARFSMPLFMVMMARKWEAILSALFTNNVIDQKQPGGSLVLMSSAFLTKALPSKTSEEADEAGVSEISSLEGIDWIAEKRNSGNFRLIPPIIGEDGNTYTEVLVKRWSNQLYRTDDYGNKVPVSIDELNNTNPELLNQIWYRIPYEKKGSSVYAKVVGFLPDTAPNVIVTAYELIAQSDEDHDFDKRYGMYYQLYTDAYNDIRKYEVFEEHSNDAFYQWLINKISNDVKKAVWANPSEALKTEIVKAKAIQSDIDKINTALKDIITEHKETIDDFLTRVAEAVGVESHRIASKTNTIGNIIDALIISIDSTYELANAQLEAKQNVSEDQLDAFNKVYNQTLASIKEYESLLSQFHKALNDFKEDWKAANAEIGSDGASSKGLKSAQRSRLSSLQQVVARLDQVAMEDIRNEFNTLPVSEINPREAYNNRIVEIMSAVLKNRTHYIESLKPSGFREAIKVMDELKEVLPPELADDASFSDITTQDFLRNRNIEGRVLKGMAANANGFLPIMQVTRMELPYEFAFITKHLSTEVNADELKKKYGENNVYIEENNQYVVASSIPIEDALEEADETEFTIFDVLSKNKVSSSSYKASSGKPSVIDVLSLTSNDGITIDEVAQIASSQLEGVTVTSKDVLNFMLKYKSLGKYTFAVKEKYAKTKLGKNLAATRNEIPNEVFVRHTRFGHNINDEKSRYTNIDGITITDAVSEVLALSLDIVKEGMIPNLNQYTFNVAMSMLMTGVSTRYVGMFINQPILRELVQKVSAIESMMLDDYGNEVVAIRKSYEDMIAKLDLELGNEIGSTKQLEIGFEHSSTKPWEIGFEHGGSQLRAYGDRVLTADELKANIIFAQNKNKLNPNTTTPRVKSSNYIFTYARHSENGYEVSSAGDKRFSALYAKLKDGRTIEEAYQLDVKGYRVRGNDWHLGKNKPPLKAITREDSWLQYKDLWRTYLNENPGLLEDLREKAKGKTLTDKFASSGISQNKALAELLNESNSQSSQPSKPAVKSDVQLLKDFYLQQIAILDYFQQYAKSGEGFSDVAKAASMDRKTVGPSISSVLALHDSIYHSAHYASPTRDYLPTNAYWSPFTGDFDDIVTLPNFDPKKDKGTDEEFQVISTGARVLINIGNGDKVPAVVALFPDHFGRKEESVYPILNEFKKYGYDLGYSVIAPMMLAYHPAIVNFAVGVHNLLDKRFDQNLFDKASSFVINKLTAQTPWIKAVPKEEVLGVNSKFVDDADITIEEFKKLSTANKLYIVKRKMADKIDNTNHVLNYLNPLTREEDVERVGYHAIEFTNMLTETTLDNMLISSFRSMFNSNDPFEADLARSLVRFSFHTTAFAYKMHGFSKIIPNDVFISPETGITDYIRRIQGDLTNMVNLYEDLADDFMRTLHSDNRYVPTVSRASIVNFDRYEVNPSTKIMSISAKNFQKLSDRVRNAPYLNVTDAYVKGEGTEREYIQTTKRLYKFIYHEDDRYYYAPVDKLGTPYLIETEGRSAFKYNNLELAPEMYQQLHKSIGAHNNQGVNIRQSKALDASPSYEFVWSHATGHIGGVDKADAKYNTFNKFARQSFKTTSNKGVYTADDLILVTADTMLGRTTADVDSVTESSQYIVNYIRGNNGTFLNEYKDINKALEAGATLVMLNDRSPRFDPNFHVGIRVVNNILREMVNNGDIRSWTDEARQIVYYGKEHNLKTIEGNKCL